MGNSKWTAACLLAVALLVLCTGCADEGNPIPQIGFVDVTSGPHGDGSSNFADGSTDSGGDADSASTVDPCDDGNPCTADVEEADGSCTHAILDGTACDDGDACTSDECKAGICVGLTKACSDGNKCTVNDTCMNGSCLGSAVSCNDVNVCTADTCKPAVGCQYAPLSGGACDDGNASTVGDVCNVGVCVGAAPSCDDKNVCTVDSGDPANGTACAHSPLVCDDGNVCTTDTCNPASGCVFKNNAAPCDDGDACTLGEKCSGAACAGGVAPVCNDSSPCTSDACDPSTGCAFVILTGVACDDGNACTSGDQCNSAGTCKGGPTQSCNDSNVCTIDTCDPAVGCLHAPLSGGGCDDGNAGTVNDECLAGKCSGSSLTCDDGDACTVDGGNAPACTHALIVCDDKNQCTTDTCSPATGCVYTPNTVACDDGNKCTVNDVCANGSCSGSAVSCDDGNPCTNDACAPATGVCGSVAIPGCGVGEVCGNGKDDDGDGKVDCADSKCGPDTKGPTYCFDSQFDGAQITVYASDKPGVPQNAPVPTTGQCYQFYCGESPLTVTVSNTVNPGGWLRAWATDPGTTTPEKPVTKNSYWGFKVTESGFPGGTPFPWLDYTSPNGYAFTITWPYK